jgi:hypothetical protein
MYSVANALNLDKFVTPKRLEESKNGNTIYQLNKWLDEDGLNYNIECMYHTVFTNPDTKHGVKIPHECEIKSDSSSKVIPILLNVQKTKESRTHLIAALLTHNGLVLLDSLADDIVPCDWCDLNNKYEFVYGIWIFQEHAPNAKGYICFEANSSEPFSIAPATFN